MRWLGPMGRWLRRLGLSGCLGRRFIARRIGWGSISLGVRRVAEGRTLSSPSPSSPGPRERRGAGVGRRFAHGASRRFAPAPGYGRNRQRYLGLWLLAPPLGSPPL